MTAVWRLAGPTSLRLYSATSLRVGGLQHVDTERDGRGRNHGIGHRLDPRQSAGASPISHQYIAADRPTARCSDRLHPVLVTRRADGTFGGVSVAVARALATHLGVPIDLKPYDNPARYNESLATDDWVSGLLRAIPRAQSTSSSVATACKPDAHGIGDGA
jgi:hypothetical protein